MRVLFHRISLHLAQWQLLCPEGKKGTLKDVCGALEHLVLWPPPIDVAGTWVKDIDGTIHQLVIKQLEASWEFVEKGSTWDGAIGLLEHDLPEGFTWKKQ
jgi:hypothetical protein